jgi:hypothetical protein
MSEEEKQAMKELKHYGNITSYYKEREYTDIQIEKYINIVLNLIDKQQKEIEKLKDKIRMYEKNYVFAMDYINLAEEHDKALKVIDKQQKEIECLKHLKGFIRIDNNHKMELLKLTDYISKDRIREKIEELKSIGKYKLDHKDLYLEQESIDLLEELLGEEDEN